MLFQHYYLRMVALFSKQGENSKWRTSFLFFLSLYTLWLMLNQQGNANYSCREVLMIHTLDILKHLKSLQNCDILSGEVI